MVALHLLILIHLTVVKCFQTSPPSLQPKYLNYFGQCRTNHRPLITSRHHSWNHVPTLSPFSYHTWQTYPKPRPLFHPNSNWHLSHPCWKTWFTKIGSRKLQTNIQSEYHRQNPRAPCPSTFLSSHFKISQFFSLAVCLSQISFYRDCFA